MSSAGYRPADMNEDISSFEDHHNSSGSSGGLIRIVIYTLITIILLALFIWIVAEVVTRPDDEFIIGNLIMEISPYIWAYSGLIIAFSLSVIGAAWGIFIIGSTLMGAAVRVPRVRTKNLISILFCEAVAIYGVIFTVIMKDRLGAVYVADKTVYFAGFSLFWAGVTVGISELVCAMAVGVIGSSAVLADAHNSSLFVRILVIEIFASAIGLFGLIAGFIQMISATAVETSL